MPKPRCGPYQIPEVPDEGKGEGQEEPSKGKGKGQEEPSEGKGKGKEDPDEGKDHFAEEHGWDEDEGKGKEDEGKDPDKAKQADMDEKDARAMMAAACQTGGRPRAWHSHGEVRERGMAAFARIVERAHEQEQRELGML